jgi:hypothetical protein
MMIKFAYLGDYTVKPDSGPRKTQSPFKRTRRFSDESVKSIGQAVYMEIDQRGSSVEAEQISTPSCDTTGPLAMHARLFALGSKYLIESLRELAVAKFRAETQSNDRSLPVTDLATAMDIAFTTGTDQEPEMRNCICDCILDRIEEVMRVPELRDSIERCDGLQTQIIERLARKSRNLRVELTQVKASADYARKNGCGPGHRLFSGP